MLRKVKCFFCFILIHFLFGTSHGKQNHHCIPSSCGNIRNISYPFRLKDDPKHCGEPYYELACENNTTTSVCFDSQKYLVQTINYSNYTIRLTDAAVSGNDSCSFPKHSLSLSNFPFGYPMAHSIKIPEGSRYMSLRPDKIRSITFMSCSYPVHNSLLLETSAHCVDRNDNSLNESNRRHTYIKLGHLNGSYVMDTCTIEVMVMTSLPLDEDGKSVSLSEIHRSLIYGFELSWISALCGANCKYCWLDGEKATCTDPCSDIWPFPCGIALILQYGIVPAVALNIALRIIIGMPCILTALLIYKLRRRHLSKFDIIEGFLRSNNNLMPIRYSYSDIKKMTGCFREKLGEGGYGSVYKGKLRSGLHVAVKLLSKHKENGQDFINEVATIGRIHHVNVVKLVGYCVERSKRALVYDFMPNGSLEKYIFRKQRTNHSLSWERKYEIAIGVARGIEYLHKGCDIQILHFDIKPHNILLDENFTPKISDFGLAKFYSVEKNAVTLTAARGTIGYVAPELINRGIGEVSYKADVYSFGMLLMEMVGLKRDMVAAGDDKSSQYFPYWIYDRFNKGEDIETGKVDDEIDEGDDDSEYARKVTKKMAIVGLWCIQMSPVGRPSMSEVLKMLEGENEDLQIPPQPSESPQVECCNDQSWDTEWTDSLALLGRDANSGE